MYKLNKLQKLYMNKGKKKYTFPFIILCVLRKVFLDLETIRSCMIYICPLLLLSVHTEVTKVLAHTSL
jgi:hypothetical protein